MGKIGKYEILETLGDGAFGKVKRAIDTETGKTVAIKFLDKDLIKKQNMSKQIQREISIMRKVKHMHVVNLKEVLASNTKIFIVMESVTGGDLFDKIVAASKFSEKQARRFFRQLISGLDYCHKQGVVHRDLKPENLLLTDAGLLKISDFGLSAEQEDGVSAQAEERMILRTTCGTSNYIAPEVLGDKGYDGVPADIWSTGIILFVMVAGYLPFDDRTTSRLFKKIIEDRVVYPASFSSSLVALLDGLLQKEPTLRWTCQQIREAAWYREGSPSEADADAEEESAWAKADGEAEVVVEVGMRRPELIKRLQSPDGDMAGIRNAFELIGRAGGVMPEGDAVHANAVLNRGNSMYAKTTRWTTALEAAAALREIALALDALGLPQRPAEKDEDEEEEAPGLQIAAETSKGVVSATVVVLRSPVEQPGGDPCYVDWRHAGGDIGEYYELFRRCKERCCGPDGTRQPPGPSAQYDSRGTSG